MNTGSEFNAHLTNSKRKRGSIQYDEELQVNSPKIENLQRPKQIKLNKLKKKQKVKKKTP